MITLGMACFLNVQIKDIMHVHCAGHTLHQGTLNLYQNAIIVVIGGGYQIIICIEIHETKDLLTTRWNMYNV
jgi:hypothetical protein